MPPSAGTEACDYAKKGSAVVIYDQLGLAGRPEQRSLFGAVRVLRVGMGQHGFLGLVLDAP